MEEIMYEKSYQEYKAELDNVLEKTAEGFVRIGYLLKVARDTNVLAESGYSTVTEFAQAEYNIDKTQVSRFIHINDKFSENGYSDQLMENYKGYGYAKLTLMLQLPDAINEELSPNYSKAEIQAIKEEIEEESKITDIEVLLEGQDETKAVLNSDISEIIDQIGEDMPELFVSIHNLLNSNKEYNMQEAISIMAPTGEKTYTVRIRGVGRKMLILRDTDEEAKIIDIRSNEKTTCTWNDIMDAWIARMDPERDAKKDWEYVHGKDYPEEEKEAEQPKARKQSKVTKAVTKKEVAPVQPEIETESTKNETENKEIVTEQEKNNNIVTSEQIPGQMNVDDYPELTPKSEYNVDNSKLQSEEIVEKTECEVESANNFENVEENEQIIDVESREIVEKTECEDGFEDTKKVNVTVGEVANTAINLFAQDCMTIAKENWSEIQVKMLQQLFECVKKGCEYKCVGCVHYGKAADAPETTEEDCMWTPNEDNGWNLPCEED